MADDCLFNYMFIGVIAVIGVAILFRNNAATEGYSRFYSDTNNEYVISDPFTRLQKNAIPVRAENLKLTEKQLQDIPYIPRRIRPPHGFVPTGCYIHNDLKRVMDDAGKPPCQQEWIKKILNKPSQFY